MTKSMSKVPHAP